MLVTGTTGSGKSTTLAAMIDHINNTRDRAHHHHRRPDRVPAPRQQSRFSTSARSAVDTRSFAHALRSALRQDPDVILVGEMRDIETIETALHAAETGHLVFSTLHTLDATETINRIISVFPPHQQKQIRLQLASVLKAAVSQRLIPRIDGAARVPAVEVLIATPFVRDCIVDKEKTHLIKGAIAPGHVAVRDADVRPVDLQPVLAGPGDLRGGVALGLERRRVQAQGAGHLHDRRIVARPDGRLALLARRPTAPPSAPEITRFGG